MISIILNADQTTSFMEVDITKEELDAFVDYMDALPVHYIMYFAHASAIIGYHHPDENIAGFWRNLYYLIVKMLYLTPETKEEIDNRLKDVN